MPVHQHSPSFSLHNTWARNKDGRLARQRKGGRELSLRLSHLSVPGITFLALCLCIALGATRSLDWWGQSLLARLSFSLLDLTGALLTLLSEASITGAIAVVLAVRGWHHRRERGLGPLLLFAG